MSLNLKKIYLSFASFFSEFNKKENCKTIANFVSPPNQRPKKNKILPEKAGSAKQPIFKTTEITVTTGCLDSHPVFSATLEHPSLAVYKKLSLNIPRFFLSFHTLLLSLQKMAASPLGISSKLGISRGTSLHIKAGPCNPLVEKIVTKAGKRVRDSTPPPLLAFYRQTKLFNHSRYAEEQTHAGSLIVSVVCVSHYELRLEDSVGFLSPTYW